MILRGLAVFLYVRDCTNKEGTATTLYLLKKKCNSGKVILEIPTEMLWLHVYKKEIYSTIFHL